MDEITTVAGSGSAVVLEGIPQPKRNGSKGLILSTWLGRGLKVAYTDCHGGGQETSGVYLDHCPNGLILHSVESGPSSRGTTSGSWSALTGSRNDEQGMHSMFPRRPLRDRHRPLGPLEG